MLDAARANGPVVQTFLIASLREFLVQAVGRGWSALVDQMTALIVAQFLRAHLRSCFEGNPPKECKR